MRNELVLQMINWVLFIPDHTIFSDLVDLMSNIFHKICLRGKHNYKPLKIDNNTVQDEEENDIFLVKTKVNKNRLRSDYHQINCVLTISPGYNTGEEYPNKPQRSSMHYVEFCTFQTIRISTCNRLCNEQVNQEVI